jgi:hypothetical protein
VSPARQAASASRNPGPLAVGAGQAVIDVDPVSLDPQAGQALTLGGEVLLIGGASGVPDKQRAYGAPPELGSFGPQDVAGSSIGQRPTPPSRRSPLAAARAAPQPQRDRRGTRLGDVLAAQAADVRESSKRAMIETGQRKEAVMMVTVDSDPAPCVDGTTVGANTRCRAFWSGSRREPAPCQSG